MNGPRPWEVPALAAGVAILWVALVLILHSIDWTGVILHAL